MKKNIIKIILALWLGYAFAVMAGISGLGEMTSTQEAVLIILSLGVVAASYLPFKSLLLYVVLNIAYWYLIIELYAWLLRKINSRIIKITLVVATIALFIAIAILVSGVLI